MTKAERLREMERLYCQRAFSDIEMAERLGVNRSTVFRDRAELESELLFLQDEQGRWRIDRTHYLSNIKLSLNEALALYLAARRTSRQTRIAQPHVASALEKLAASLKQPMSERLVKSAGAVLDQSKQPERVKVLEVIAQGWVEGRKLRITHRGLHGKEARVYLVSPYLIEPSIWSEGTYLIGDSDVHGGIATFKIERIERAALTNETFTIDEGFDDQQLLRYAWGIWYGENAPVTVKLRFAPGDAARRLKESIWHPTQKIEDAADGGCLWSAQVAEWQEMVPWVRGWGADVEVVEPKSLRETLMGEAKVLAEKYGWFVSSQPERKRSTLDDFFGK
jgi:CRISPR-associated endonuclease/helicase Cas3